MSTTIDVFCSQDTYVESSESGSAHGDYYNVMVGNYPDNAYEIPWTAWGGSHSHYVPSGTCRGFWKVPLTDGSLTGEVIDSATLVLPQYFDVFGAAYNISYGLYKVTNSWDESTLTWDNADYSGMTLVTTFDVSGAGAQTFDITSYVAAAIGGDISFMVKLLDESAGDGYQKYGTKNFAENGYLTSHYGARNSAYIEIVHHTPSAGLLVLNTNWM